MRRLDVALMTFDLEPSGVVSNVLRIAEAALEAGLQTEIWTVQDVGSRRPEVPTGVIVRSLGREIGTGYSRKARKAAAMTAVPRLASALREQQPSVAFSCGNHFHQLAAEAARLARPAWNGRLLGRVSNALPRFSWAPQNLPWSIYKRAAARRRLNAMDRLITVSEALRRDLIGQLCIRAPKISAIPNGIDLVAAQGRAAQPLSHPWFGEREPPVILGAGRLVPQKGFEALIDAFAEAREAMPLRLLLLGDGPERYRLAARANVLGIAEDVRFEGYVTNPLPYFRNSALFVLSSRWEGMSNALLEALAVGCISVATRCPGSVEVLGETLSGQIVPVSDTHALASAIVTNVVSPPPKGHFLARAAEYDLRSTLNAYVEVLREEAARL